jgi:phenylacetic acid degradation operon negative regulatory protein
MPDSFQNAAQRALRAFRRQRPLRAGSLIITLFGDAIAPRGGSISLASLITLMASFGLTERLVRTAVGRLAHDGWLQAGRSGRLSYYGLSALGRERFAEATRRIYAAPPAGWNGEWTLVLANGDGRSRRRLRSELEWLGFGQIGPGSFAHPDADIVRVRRELEDPGLLDSALVLSARAEDAAGDRRIIDSGWNLKNLEQRYRRFLELFAPVRDAARKTRTRPGEASLVVRTLLIHEYRRVHLRDPLLPQSLLPASWPGAAAYELSRSLYRLVFRDADDHLSGVATTRRGTLPNPTKGLLRRFGGLDVRARA